MPFNCSTCRDTGTVLKHRPTIYCTDSDDEIEDAYRMASRPCPDCAKRKRLQDAAPELLEVLRQMTAWAGGMDADGEEKPAR